MTINNNGIVSVETNREDANITFVANFLSSGKTSVKNGTLQIAGYAEQVGSDTSTFQLIDNASVIMIQRNFWTPDPPSPLVIRQGSIIGDGVIVGDLILGASPAAGGAATNPIISPGDATKRIATIQVKGNLRMYSGEMRIEVSGADKFDKVWVEGYTSLGPTGGGWVWRPGGKIVGALLPGHDEIAANTQMDFLQRANNPSNTNFSSLAGLGEQNSGWQYGSTCLAPLGTRCS